MEARREVEVFRAPMRARSLDAGLYEGARHGVARSLAGIGEPLSSPPADLLHALKITEDEFGEKSGHMLARFAGLPDGVILWTRTGEDEFRAGVLAGPWRYDRSDEAMRTGICQVRPTSWSPEAFSHVTVPEAVAFTFSRGGRNLQRIADPDTEEISQRLFGNR